jgi:hypothetical protein
VQMNDQMKMSCQCGNGIHFFDDFEIRNSHFATVPHSFKKCVFTSTVSSPLGCFCQFWSTIFHLDPWTHRIRLSKALETWRSIAPSWRHRRISEKFGVRNIRHEFKFKGHPCLRVTGDHLGLFHHGEIVLYLRLYFKIQDW